MDKYTFHTDEESADRRVYLGCPRRSPPWSWLSRLSSCAVSLRAAACTRPQAPPTSLGKLLCRDSAPLWAWKEQRWNSTDQRGTHRGNRSVQAEPPSPSGGSRDWGPLGRKPFMAHSIICLVCISTPSASSLASQEGTGRPALTLATWSHTHTHTQPNIKYQSAVNFLNYTSELIYYCNFFF